MTVSFGNRKYILIGIFLLLLCGFGGLLSSCEKRIYEELPPCGVDVRFVYDYNMKYADAFVHEVKRVNLYLFDEQGILQEHWQEEGNPFAADFVIPVHVPVGKYKLLAWCGLSDETYSFPSVTKGATTMEELQVELKTIEGKSDKEIGDLYHSMIQEVEITRAKKETITMPLTKDTNTFRIMLYSADKIDPVDITKYDFKIVSDNRLYAHDNTPIVGHEVTYLPYLRENKESQVKQGVNYTLSVVELKTGRLMGKEANNLVITHKTNDKELLNINLSEYLQMYKLAKYGDMPLQEFLDRQDEYVMSFFFDEGTSLDHFVSVELWINDWVVRVQNVELG